MSEGFYLPRCNAPGHEQVLDVDDNGWAFESCRRDDGSFHGDAMVYPEPVNPTAASMIRAQAERAIRLLTRRSSYASGRGSRTVASSTPTGRDIRPGNSAAAAGTISSPSPSR